MMEKTNKNIPKFRFPDFSDKWIEKRLSEIVNINPKNNKLPDSFIYIDLESVTNGELLKEDSIELNEAPSRAQRLLEKGDVLFQMVRPYQKNNLYFDKDGDYVASTGYAQLRTSGCSKFIFQYLHFQKFVDKVILRSTGTNYPAINSSDLSDIEVAVPSLPEQQKVASFLFAVDEKIQTLKKKKTLLEQYKKGVMQKIFSQELRFKDESGDDYPDWEEKTLNDVSISYYQGINTASDKTIYYSKGFPILQAKHITSEIITYSDAKYVCDEDFNRYKEKYNPKINEILISNIGTLGKIVLIENDVEFLVAWNIFKVKIKENICNPKYITYVLKYVASKGYFEEVQSGNATKFVNKTEMLAIPILLPSLSEQTKISNFLSALDNKIHLCTTQIEKTELYKKGLLQKMFC